MDGPGSAANVLGATDDEAAAMGDWPVRHLRPKRRWVRTAAFAVAVVMLAAVAVGVIVWRTTTVNTADAAFATEAVGMLAGGDTATLCDGVNLPERTVEMLGQVNEFTATGILTLGDLRTVQGIGVATSATFDVAVALERRGGSRCVGGVTVARRAGPPGTVAL